MSSPLSDEELEILSEKLLAKLLGRLAARAKAENDDQTPLAKRPPPSPEAIAAVLARRRRKGR